MSTFGIHPTAQHTCSLLSPLAVYQSIFAKQRAAARASDDAVKGMSSNTQKFFLYNLGSRRGIIADGSTRYFEDGKYAIVPFYSGVPKRS